MVLNGKEKEAKRFEAINPDFGGNGVVLRFPCGTVVYESRQEARDHEGQINNTAGWIAACVIIFLLAVILCCFPLFPLL